MGYYKIHPEIPTELSEKAKNFILCCFEPDPDKRATAAELLEDSFLTEYVSFIIMINILHISSKKAGPIHLSHQNCVNEAPKELFSFSLHWSPFSLVHDN